MAYIDVHCHIDQYDKEELKEIFMTNKDRVKVVGAAMNRESGARLLDLQKLFPSLSICLGIHPEYPQYFDEFNEVKRQILEHRDKIAAIGEIGLPYYSLENLEEDEKEKCIKEANELLIKFLDLAKELDLPVVLHAIENTASTALEELKKRKIKRALFHWFEGDLDVLKEIVMEGYYISVSPDVMYNGKYGDFVTHIPIENMVLESDGPWEYNGKKGVPAMVMDIITYLSKGRNMEEDVIEKIVYENSWNLFGKDQ